MEKRLGFSEGPWWRNDAGAEKKVKAEWEPARDSADRKQQVIKWK